MKTRLCGIFIPHNWENQQKFKIAFLCLQVTRDLSISNMITTKSNKLKIVFLGVFGASMMELLLIYNFFSLRRPTPDKVHKPEANSLIIFTYPLGFFSITLTAYFALSLV